MNMDLTQLYDKSYNWILVYGPRIVLAVVLILAGQWLLKLLRGWMSKALQKRDMDASLRPFLQSMVITILQVLLIMAAMQVMGIEMTVFAALVGGIGVAIGLALSGTLQNFTSGILILLLKPYRVGDSVMAQGQEGLVTSIQIFYTIMTTFDNKTVIIPNSKLSNEVIVNLSREGIRRLDIELKFGFAYSYTAIAPQIEKIIAQAENVLKQPAARMGVIAIEPDGYRIAVQVWVKAHGFMDAKLAFQEKLIEDLKAAGIKLPGMA